MDFLASLTAHQTIGEDGAGHDEKEAAEHALIAFLRKAGFPEELCNPARLTSLNPFIDETA